MTVAVAVGQVTAVAGRSERARGTLADTSRAPAGGHFGGARGVAAGGVCRGGPGGPHPVGRRRHLRRSLRRGDRVTQLAGWSVYGAPARPFSSAPLAGTALLAEVLRTAGATRTSDQRASEPCRRPPSRPAGRARHDQVFRTGRPVRLDDYPAPAARSAARSRRSGSARRPGCRSGSAARCGAVPASCPSITTPCAPGPRRASPTSPSWWPGRSPTPRPGPRVRRLADAQATLRRVATLVSRQPSPGEVFTTVVRELGTLLRVDDRLTC